MNLSYAIGMRDARPWGHWEVLDVGLSYVVKRITVAAYKRLSLQYHSHRKESWTCLAGEGIVTLGEVERPFVINEMIRVPVGMPHRVANRGSDDLVFTEVQLGQFLHESDIVRLCDDFGRD